MRAITDEVHLYVKYRTEAFLLPRPGYAPRSEGRGSRACRLMPLFQPLPDPVPSPFRERVSPRHGRSDKYSCSVPHLPQTSTKQNAPHQAGRFLHPVSKPPHAAAFTWLAACPADCRMCG